MIKPVILWTDSLIFLLAAVVVIFILYARNKPHISTPWKRVFSGKVAAAAIIVLLAFVLVGRGLGASGAMMRFTAWLTSVVAPEHVNESAY